MARMEKKFKKTAPAFEDIQKEVERIDESIPQVKSVPRKPSVNSNSNDDYNLDHMAHQMNQMHDMLQDLIQLKVVVDKLEDVPDLFTELNIGEKLSMQNINMARRFRAYLSIWKDAVNNMYKSFPKSYIGEIEAMYERNEIDW